MPRKKLNPEPEDPEPKTPGESLPAMEDTVRKLSGIFTENMRIQEGPPVIESEDDELNRAVTFPGDSDEDEEDE